jgi:hypothetical protein
MNPEDFNRRVDQVAFALMEGYKSTFQKMKDKLFWEKIPGIEVIVKWPTANDNFTSTDPNEHYRKWLEKNCGKQSLDWDWKIKDTNISRGELTIRFKRRHKDIAVLVALMWG